MNETKISWATVTWNPLTGCSKISEGCRHCYAERLSRKFNQSPSPWTALNISQNLKIHPERLNQVDKLKPGQRIFVNSMSDLFHEAVSDEFIKKIFWKMFEHPEHEFVILTKRSARLKIWPGPWAPNIWAGVSIENQANIGRLNDLRSCKSFRKLVSFEPLLGPIETELSGLRWIIVGGESGPDFRPMDMAWARALRDQTIKEKIPFFFKQDAALISETRPWLIEANGKKTIIQEFPPTRSKLAL